MMVLFCAYFGLCNELVVTLFSSIPFPASQYLFQVPNRYIFHGAEVYSCSEDETSSSSDNEGSYCSGSGLEEQESDAEEECTPGDCPRPGEGGCEETVDGNKCMTSIQTDNTMENLDTMTDL